MTEMDMQNLDNNHKRTNLALHRPRCTDRGEIHCEYHPLTAISTTHLATYLGRPPSRLTQPRLTPNSSICLPPDVKNLTTAAAITTSPATAYPGAAETLGRAVLIVTTCYPWSAATEGR